MLLFTILAITLILLVVVGVIALGVGGAFVTIMFADVIVCIVLIVCLIRFLMKR